MNRVGHQPCGLGKVLRRAAAAAVAALALLGAPAPAETVTLVADEWCPFNCEPGSDRPGFMVEIAREALAIHGYALEYRVVSWVRSLEQARRGEVHGVIGAVREEAPGLVFGPAIGSHADAVALRVGEMIDVNDPATFEGRVFGAINGYAYSNRIAEFIDAHRDDRSRVQFATGDRPLRQNLLKLVHGRLDVVADTSAVLHHTIAELGLADQVHVLRVADVEPIYIALAPGRPETPALVGALERGIAALQAEGRVEAIMAKYGMPGWE